MQNAGWLLGLLLHKRLFKLSTPSPFSFSLQKSMAAAVKHLQAVSRALALGYGMSSEFRFLPDTWGLRELHIVHNILTYLPS